MTDSVSKSARLFIRLFGPMKVLVDEQPLPAMRSRKSLWLLALLVLRAGRPVEREWLAGTLWPDIDAARASSNLRVVLSELRRALGSQGERLQSSTRHTLSLDLTGADVDVSTFDAALVARKPTGLKEAIALYQGPLLEGCGEEWVAQERAVRERGCLQALLGVASDALAGGNFESAAEYYRQGVGLDPLSETAQRGLMQALAQAGDINAALDVYQSFVRMLRRDDPRAAPDEKTSALNARLRMQARQLASSVSSIADVEAATAGAAGYLPNPITELIGRDDERSDVAARLRRSRLVTLTGPGGIGKTRLALAVGSEVRPEFKDGVWMVALETLLDGAYLERHIAAALAVKEAPDKTLLKVLTEHLRSRCLLIVLDNCEHLLDASANIVCQLLRECSGIRILATSREPLGVTGEAIWPVPALAVPEPAHLPAGRATLVRVLQGYESVQLFVERAQSVHKNFTITGDNALSIARICARLEGIPLAIELAAARIKVLTVQQIVDRLDNHLALLKGSPHALLPRHQTLRATLDWSYDLLNDTERLVLQRLSVFAGGCDLDAAERVCAGDGVDTGDILDLLASLTDKSLAIFTPDYNGAIGRYRLLETVRQYAAEQLAKNTDAGGTEPIRARHRVWMVDVVAAFYEGRRGPKLAELTRRLQAEYDNLRATLSWEGIDASDVDADLTLLSRVRPFWESRGLYAKGRAYLERALARCGKSCGTSARADALRAAGVLCSGETDYAAARIMLTESLGIYRRIGDKRAIATVLHDLSNIAQGQSDYTAATQLLEESLQYFHETADEVAAGTVLTSLGNLYGYRGDYAKSKAMYEDAISIFRKIDDRMGLAAALSNLGCHYQSAGDLSLAQTLHEQSLGVFRDMGDRHAVALTLMNLGNIVQKCGTPSDARSLFEEAHSLSMEIGNRQGIRASLTCLARSAYLLGDYREALSRSAEALRICRDIGAREPLTGALRQISLVLFALDLPGKGVDLLAAAHTLHESLGVALQADDLEQGEQMIARAREILGDADFVAAWAEGAALTWEQASALALETASSNTHFGVCDAVDCEQFQVA